MFPQTEKAAKRRSICYQEQIRGNDVLFISSCHVETVVMLSRKTLDDVVEIDLDLDELDITAAESKATYPEIKAYVQEHYGLKIPSLYIAQVKRKCGLDVGDNYNLPKSEGKLQPQVPSEKENAIREALKHFAMI